MEKTMIVTQDCKHATWLCLAILTLGGWWVLWSPVLFCGVLFRLADFIKLYTLEITSKGNVYHMCSMGQFSCKSQLPYAVFLVLIYWYIHIIS